MSSSYISIQSLLLENAQLGFWISHYDITQVYDKNGNRTGYDKNVAGGSNTSYGKQYNLTYTFDNVNSISAISDADDANYSCAVTCDANGNITQVDESTSGVGAGALHTYFEYDALNRLTAYKTKKNMIAGVTLWNWTKRAHQYDGTGRLVKSNWKTWADGQQEPGGDTLEHVYAGARLSQNYNGTNYGAVWHWAGAQYEHMGPLNSPNPDTASQKAYNVAAGGADVAGAAGGPAGGAGGMTPQKRTFVNPTTEGDQRHEFGQARPMAKDSSGNGANWYLGIVSQPTAARVNSVESRLFFEGTVSSTDMSLATDAREKRRIGIFGTDLSYAGSYGRVTSESIGRDLNPLGRGAGQALLGGELQLGFISNAVPFSLAIAGQGASVNNCAACGGGCGHGPFFPGQPDPIYSDIGAILNLTIGAQWRDFDPSQCSWYLAKRPQIPTGPFGMAPADSFANGNFDPFLPQEGPPIGLANTSYPTDYIIVDPKDLISGTQHASNVGGDCTPELLQQLHDCDGAAARAWKARNMEEMLRVYGRVKLLENELFLAKYAVPGLIWGFAAFNYYVSLAMVAAWSFWYITAWLRYWNLQTVYKKFAQYNLEGPYAVGYYLCLHKAEIASLLWWWEMFQCDSFNQLFQDSYNCCKGNPCCKNKDKIAYLDCNNCIAPDPWPKLVEYCDELFGRKYRAACADPTSISWGELFW